MSDLRTFIEEARDKAKDAAEFSEGVGNYEDQSYAFGVADVLGFLMARIDNDLPFQMREDDKSTMLATNGQLAEVLLFGDES